MYFRFNLLNQPKLIHLLMLQKIFTNLNFKKYYKIQLLFWFNLIIFTSVNIYIYFLPKPSLSIFLSIFLLIIITLNLYYFTNLLHLASHNLLSKRLKLNSFYGNISAIFSGLTFAEFKTSHLLHHKNPTNPDKDPDHKISQSGSIFLLPFRVWLKDKYFFEQGFWKKNGLLKGYLLNRLTQLALILFIFWQGKGFIFSIFYLLPLFIIGFLNSLFLFYYPHYTNQFEQNLIQQKNLFAKLGVKCINLSRNFHSYHHHKINNLSFYFPVEFKFKEWLFKKIY
jgi:fatty acid desaturase